MLYLIIEIAIFALSTLILNRVHFLWSYAYPPRFKVTHWDIVKEQWSLFWLGHF